jgi:hypothetical protein
MTEPHSEWLHPFAQPTDDGVDPGPAVQFLVGWNMPVDGTWTEYEAHIIDLQPIDVFDLHPELLPAMPDDLSEMDDE